MRKAIRRGDLFYADLNPVVGSEQGGIRPVLVIQNDVGNHFSPTVVAAAITSRKAKNSLPTHILLENVPGLAPTSLLLLEQLRTIDRKRLRGYIGRISKEKMLEVDAALAISIGIGYPKRKEDSQCTKMTVVCSLPEMPTD
ncbi:type II toxin-antitoxin system PemK/MazF family toxin [Clostridium sp. J1101437_171009_A5]|uniref:type II toxin-antitoxin system PemK/MazF family toxin n=1 Tax=Clostridium sp. J1101437_171009_A5 TaxID=2787098 RepID=UPI00189A3365|nr:type II toxin-antitoxin system PemK/MazF family toxin [Clostridium sp. J1101437_171009_A5]